MITLYKPEYEDLRFRQTMLADAETMSYNHAWGGTVEFPETDWAEWYDRWIVRTEGRRFYRYLKNESGEFVGEAAYHYDPELGCHVADVIVYAKYRGRGYGGQALDLLCLAAKENGLSVLYDNIAADNPATGFFLRRGFTEEYRTDEIIMLNKVL